MNDFVFPENAPIWVTLVTLLAGWAAANVWPVVKDMLQKRFGVELNAIESQIELLRAHVKNEQQLAVVIERLSTLMEYDIKQTKELEEAVQSLTSVVDTTLKTLPTTEDFNKLVARVAFIQQEVHALKEKIDAGTKTRATGAG